MLDGSREKYCFEGKAIKTVKARSIWFKILDAQMETGTPYLLYKDEANEKSNYFNDEMDEFKQL